MTDGVLAVCTVAYLNLGIVYTAVGMRAEAERVNSTLRLRYVLSA